MNNDKISQKEITLKDIHDDIRELLRWIKFTGIKEVKPILELKLETDTKKIVYTMSDGNISSTDIAKKVGTISQRTVSNYWQEWTKVGIGEPIPVMGGGNRFKRSFDLDDFGITIPEIHKNVEKAEQPRTTTESQLTEQPTKEVESNGS